MKSFGSAVGVFLLTVDNAGYETLLTNFFGGLLAEAARLAPLIEMDFMSLFVLL